MQIKSLLKRGLFFLDIKWSHDQLNRLLNTERIPARQLWRSVRNDIDFDEDGYILFDDTVLPKPYAKEIQPVRHQWIGLVTCVYVNPKTHRYWIIDYRIYDYDRDGKTKLQHLEDMLCNAYFVKCLPFRTVLIDSWYASMRVMKSIQALSKIYYAPLKCNRLVNDSDGVDSHKRVDTLTWTQAELREGKLVHIKKFPRDHQVKLFRIASASGRTEYIATTIYLNQKPKRRNKNVAFAGRLSSFIVNSSKPQVPANAKVVNIVDNATISPAVYGSG